jgi:hypothetical protein
MSVTNLMMLEPLLQARLQEQLADITPKVHVLAASDLAGVTEATQVTPAVHLLYRRYSITESRADGRAVRMEQTWLAVVATRNVRNLRSGAAARADAGLIARRVASALMGFVPALGIKPLRLTTAPDAGNSGGYQYLPLAFVTELVLD